MPSYVDFDSTKHFRDSILNKTLTAPNGPQTFTAGDYIVNNVSDMSNVDLGTVDSNRDNDLLTAQKTNIYKPDEYFINENVNTYPRRANLTLYPYFEYSSYHNYVSVFASSNYDNESQLMKFALWNIKKNPEGPVFARIEQNLYTSTVGKVRVLDALEGNLATALNLVTGREPLVEGNSKITVANTLPGKTIDFMQTVAGVEFPFTEIPGDYLSNPRRPTTVIRPEAETEMGRLLQDASGVLASLIGIQRRPTITRKPSDLFIEYLGYRNKMTLFDNISYSKYAPDYTTTARSQNTSKIFSFVDNLAQNTRNLLGTEAPKGVAYIGDDRGDDVRYAMNDFNDRPVRSSYYLSLMFDPIQAQLFQRERNIGEGGGIGGKLTWISSKSRNILGINNAEFPSEKSQYEDSLSTGQEFRDDSILGLTQQILETMPADGGAARSHVANVIDQTSRIFRENNEMLSRGSAIKYVDQFTQQESGVEYCRVWTKDRSYMNYSDTMKRQGNVRKFESSVLNAPWNLNIYPNSNAKGEFDAGSTNIARGKGDGFYAKKYMFSIENLAWKMSNTPGFTYNDLPYCERGPNGGRVMWFPPYDLKMSEQNSANWNRNTFLGRPEPIFTYQDTERVGQISFKVIVDHPSILNLLVKKHFEGMSDEESDNYINAFFAGCEDVDFYGLIRKYTTLSPDELKAVKSYLNQNKDIETVKKYKTVFMPVISDTPTPQNGSNSETIEASLLFENDFPKIDNDDLKSNFTYTELYTKYVSYYNNGGYLRDLNTGLEILSGATTWGTDQANDARVLYGYEKSTKPEDSVFNDGNIKAVNDITDGFTDLTTIYDSFINGLTLLKTRLEKNEVESINMILESKTSSIGNDNYNLKLSYRRSYAVITDIIKRISVNDEYSNNIINNIEWQVKIKPSDVTAIEPPMLIPFKDLGYASEGNLKIDYISNVGEQAIGCPDGTYNVSCTEANRILTSDKLKATAPKTFFCRRSNLQIKYTTQGFDTTTTQPVIVKGTLVEDNDTPSGNVPAPPLDEMKKMIMKTLSECYYFKKLEEDSPLQFSSLKEKLKYFHPAFHSMTPEGLNARLTFLNQCVRPGDTLPIKGLSDESDLNARNTTFGPPPICILRVGDFYHSKIVIRDVNITFEEGLWDLNPEGIGVQPMMANVQLQVNFIGGHGLDSPVKRLQNALSSNFYANTEMYDPRSIATEDRTKVYKKEFLDYLNQVDSPPIFSDPKDLLTSANKIIEGEYIGSQEYSSMNYINLIDEPDGIYTQVENYIKTFIGGYNAIVAKYGTNIGSMLLHPNYRTIKDYTVQTGAGTDTIELLGNYKKTYELPVLVDIFKTVMSGMTETENISTIMGFNKDMPNAVLVKSEEILKPKILELILDEIDEIPKISAINKIEVERNKLIVILDKLNFIVETGGHDGKIVNNEYIGCDLNGYTYDIFYGAYSNVIDFIKNNQNKFTEELDTSYLFGSKVMTSSDFSVFLSVLLRDKKDDITKIYGYDSVFTPQIRKNIEKRLDKFLCSPTVPSTSTSPKNFRITRYPVRKDSSSMSFLIMDETYSFSDEEKTKLLNTLRTSNYKTTDVLNYYRGNRLLFR